MIRKGTSPGAIRRATARRAVGQYLNVQWTDATVGAAEGAAASRKEGLQSAVQSVKAVTNGSPSLIFIFTDATKPAPTSDAKTTAAGKRAAPPPPEPTAQAKDSEAAWEELFQKEGDYAVFIPGRFFNVVKIDATQLKESQSKYICSEKAPMVILTRKDGTIEEVYEGRAKIKSPAITAAMASILQKDGYVTRTALFANLNALMVELEKTELALVLAGEDVAKAKSKLSDLQSKDSAKQAKKPDKEVKASTSTAAAQKAADEAESVLKAKQAARFEILKKDYALLKELGMPEAKMPDEPVAP